MSTMNITFPASPAAGDTFTIGNTTYVYDDAPGIWRAYTIGDFSSSGGSDVDPNWIPSFAANNQVASAGNSFSGTLFTAPADGNGTWGILTTGRNSTSNSVNITTTDSNTWGYIAGDETIQYLTGGGTLISQGSFSGGTNSRNAWVYLAPGDSLVFGFRFDGPSYRYVELDAYGAAGGGSTTVNIGGGGGLQLGVTAMDTLLTSRTIAAGDLTGTGPAWVMLAGGGGSGAVAQFNRVNNPSGSAGAGGAGGNYGFFISDVADLIGATFTAGASGVAQTSGALNIGDGTTVIFGANGTAGTSSTLVLDGTTYTCTGGGGGTRGNPGAAGTAGTATATGGTPLDMLDVATANADIDTYWNDFIVDQSGTLRVGGSVVDITGSGGGAGDAASASPAASDGSGPARTVTSGSGSAGMLQIVYQNQA